MAKAGEEVSDGGLKSELLSRLLLSVLLISLLSSLLFSNVTTLEVCKDGFEVVTKSEIMPRGGKRLGSGSKPKWKHGKTKVIRVPEVLVDKILALTQELDENGFIESVTDSKVLDLSGVPIFKSQKGLSVPLVALLKSGYEIKPLSLADKIISEAYRDQFR